MRVIAGKYRSRPLRSMRGMEIRPTADRLRESLFNVLCGGDPSTLEGTVWLDLFAGTGAVGIEALSRGAEKVYFVDSAAPAVDLVKTNLSALGIKNSFEVVRQDAGRALAEFESRGIVADFVFLDPPYQKEDAYRKVLQSLSKSKLVRPTGLVIAEHHKKFDPGEGGAACTAIASWSRETRP